jgi:hypothetical protein
MPFLSNPQFFSFIVQGLSSFNPSVKFPSLHAGTKFYQPSAQIVAIKYPKTIS